MRSVPLFLCSCFVAATLSAQLNLSPPAPLPGDTQPLPATGKQEKPQIAKGGDTFLAVWSDARTALAPNGGLSVGGGGPYAGPGLGTMSDLYAARLDQAGNVIDQRPIVVSQASYNQGSPQVCWNGENWLVVWYQELETDFGSYELRAARVSPAGVVLDATPLTIGPASSNLGSWPVSLLFDGTNWVVFWRGFDPSLQFRSIFAARIAANGTVLDPQGVTAFSHPDEFLSDPDVAYNGSGYLIVFHNSLDRIYGQRLSAGLAPVGSMFRINSFSPSNPTKPQVAAQGSEYFVVWDDHPFSGNIGSLIGSRVSATGQVLNPNGLVIDANVGTSNSFPSLVWNGSSWWVTYLADSQIALKRVSGAGAVLDANRIVVSRPPSYPLDPVIAPGFGGAAQIVWQEFKLDENISTAQVSASGAVGNERVVSLGAPRQSRPRLAFGGNVFLSVFQREIEENVQVYGQRTDAAGNALDAEPFLISDSANGQNGYPSVAFNGTNFLVVWERGEASGGFKVYGRRVTREGTLLDASPFAIMDGFTPDVAALGDTFLTVAIRPVGVQRRDVQAVRVSGAGAVLGTPTLVQNAYNNAVRVAAFGNRWLLVWEFHSRRERTESWIHGAFVDTAGIATPSFQVASSDNPLNSGISYDDTPHLAVAGNEALIVWSDADNDQHDIKGRRIAADGTLLGSDSGFVISDAPGRQLLPAVTWDGTTYVATWLDHRNDLYPLQPRGDIYAARVAGNEAVLDPAGFPVANTVRPEDTPFVASALGNTLFAYAAFYSGAPYNAMHVTIRRGTFASPPTITNFAQWQQTHFQPQEPNYATQSAATSDADGDGLCNLLEYAFGTDPRTAGSANAPYFQPYLQRENDDLTLVYRKRTGATDLAFAVKQSSALTGWATASTTDEILADDGVIQTIKAKVPRGGASRLFLKLEVTRAP